MSFDTAFSSARTQLVKSWALLLKKMPKTTMGRVQLGVIAAVTLLVLMFIVLYGVSRMTPDYWKHNEKLLASDNATLLQLANTFEQRALRDLSGSHEVQEPTRTVHVAFEEINAWLNIKLEDYLANRKLSLPKEIRHPMLAGKKGQLILAFELDTPQLKQVVSVTIVPIFEPSGNRFRLQLLGARAGVLPLPVQTLREQASAQSPGAKAKIDQVFNLLGNEWLEAVQHHPGDARQNLRLIGIDITEEGLDLTLRSEPRKPVDTTSPSP